MPTYIRGPGDASGFGNINNMRVVSVDVSKEQSRRKYAIVLGDGAFHNIRITIDTPDGENLSLRDVLLRAAGLELDEEVRRHTRTGPRAKDVQRRGVLI